MLSGLHPIALTHLRSDMEYALQVNDLTHKIGLNLILKKISFELKPGEALALLGPNGAGKSTLLKCLAGLLPYTGRKEVFGERMEKNPGLRRQIGYLGHETFLYLKLCARENLKFYSTLYQVAPDLDSLLQEYSLTDTGEQLVETFSRGMKQRLALARALLPNPRLLLLDEPFTGLDQQSSELLRAKLLELKGRTTLLFATHELERASEIGDKFLILKNGRQVFFGDQEEMKTEVQNFYQAVTA